MPAAKKKSVPVKALPFGMMIAGPNNRSKVFGPATAGWIDTEVGRVIAHHQLWVPALMAHAEAHRVLVTSIPALAQQKVRSFSGGFPLSTAFAANWEVYESVWQHFLTHKRDLAEQLHKHPFELEILRNHKYFGAAIGGILAEFTHSGTVALSSHERICPFCAETIKAAAVICRYCHRDLPSAG
jgi:hypothetical protein